jgi:hypothetical protein
VAKKSYRAGGIRTHDLLNPIQAFYQAELQPDLLQSIHDCQEITRNEVATCRRGDRTTKLAPASPSYGGLNYSPF